MDAIKLKKMWPDYRLNFKNRVKKELEFKYPKLLSIVKEEIVEALCFWKFVQEKMYDCNLSYAEKGQLRDVFKEAFLDNRNRLIGLIVRIESLPTSVWRKILWKYNIDFMSLESFLRRISYKEYSAICANFNDYEIGRVPQVFSRWDRFWKKITVEKLQAEEFDFDTRYKCKAEMSYNLFNLDFGFNAYPNGVADDTKIVEISPLRFLSRKNHADDFVVNKEDGKYWYLYVSARSNYVWNADEEIRLNKHICPGFWYTMFIHFWFWIASPIASAYAVAFVAGGFLHWELWPMIFFIALLLIAFLTPLWLTVALIKYLVGTVIFDKAVELSRNCYKKYESFLEVLLSIAVASFLIIVALSVTVFIYGLIRTITSVFWSCLVILDVYLILAWFMIAKKLIYEQSKMIVCLIVLISTIILGKIVVFNHLVILKAMTVLLNYLTDYFVAIGYLWVLMTFPLVIAVILLKVLREEKVDKIFKFIEKHENAFHFSAWFFTGSLLVYCVYSMYMSDFTIGFYLFAIMSFFTAGILGLSYLEPKNVTSRKVASWISDRYCGIEIDSSWIAVSPWLSSMDKEAMKEVLGELTQFVYRTFDSSTRKAVLKLLVPRLTEVSFETIMTNSLVIKGIMEEDVAYCVLDYILKGSDIVSAIKMAEEDYEEYLKSVRKKEKIINRLKAIFSFIFSPVTFIIKIFSKLVEYILTLKRIYTLFNERCPYISEDRILKL